MNIDELHKKYPWLVHVEPISTTIIATLHEKEQHYAGSWQKRGGPGAFMMAARKWDRIESIVSNKHNYDIFKALEYNTGEIIDDVDDLIGYLLMIRGKVKNSA